MLLNLVVAILGIDVGGTFTDAVLLDEGGLATVKVPTARHQEESVIEAARAVGAGALERFTHGTTVATNALLERTGARTAFVATEGFEHLLHLRRQTRADLYRPCGSHPDPLVPLERCHGVSERIGPDGVLTPLDLTSLPELDAEAVAICLLFSFREPAHEQAVAEEVRRRLPNAHVVASHEVAPEFREYERASTTAADAYLGPVTARYLRALGGSCREAGLPEPLVMRSSGGVATIEEAAAHPSWALVSGPAGGVVGAGLVARLAGFENAISFDMGGTSTDVCLIAGGKAERSSERTVGGLPIRLPSIDIHTVGAGGGSIAWRDAGGALRVGPASAGAQPGPACYGNGGTAPTVTDANLLLGRLPAQLAGGLALDANAAEQALDGLDPAAVVEVVNAEMLRALQGRVRRAGPRSARLRARRVRRRRAAACLRAGGASWASGQCWFPTRPASSRRSGSSRATSAVTTSRPTYGRSQTSRSCRRRARPTCATRASRSSSPSRSAPSSPRRFTGRTRSGTATPTATAPSSSSPSAPPRSGRARRSSYPAPPARSTPKARRSSTSPARPAGFPPGGWGIGMEIAH